MTDRKPIIEQDMTPATGERADHQGLPRHPAVEGLRAATVSALHGHLRDMFDRAEEALPAAADQGRDNDDPGTSMESLRLIRSARPKIEMAYPIRLSENFPAITDISLDDFDLDRLSIGATEEFEETLAVGAIIEKVEKQHRTVVVEFEERIAYMIRELGVQIARRPLSPAAICNAFRSSADDLDVPLRVRILLLRMFERLCASRLDEIYALAHATLDDLGIGRGSAFTASSGEPPANDATVSESVEPPALDPQTIQCLERISQLKGPTGLDASFAGSLLATLTRDQGDAGSRRLRLAIIQRISLVGQMCNEIVTDQHLPESMHPLFERLRFPLIKLALADTTFFSQRAHPVRRLVFEAADTAASSRTATRAAVRKLEGKLEHIADQINLSSAFVQPQLDSLESLPSDKVTSFLDQQREESDGRRENVVNRVRRTVAQEIEVHTLGRRIPQPMIDFLRVGWAPLMSGRLMRYGMGGPQWKDAVSRLSDFLETIDGFRDTPQRSMLREHMLKDARSCLTDLGMRPDRVDTALQHLEAAYAEHDRRSASMSDQERDAVDEFELFVPGGSNLAPGPPVTLPDSPAVPSLPSDSAELSLSEIEERTQLTPLQSEASEPYATVAGGAPLNRQEKDEIDALLAEIPGLDQDALGLPAEPEEYVPGGDTTDSIKKPAATAQADHSTPGIPEFPGDDEISAEPLPQNAIAGSPEAGKPRQNMLTERAAPSSPEHAEATPEPGETGSSDTELLSICLTAESWFRVFNKSNGQTLWMRVSRFYPEHNCVGFTGFDAKQALSVDVDDLINDLVMRRSEPVNPTPAQFRAVKKLCRRHPTH